jgi:hypothetical protein|tara:strand:- start:9877 stop:11883 length:2007 start_codon:yes stop_codon:yes gene_type:complete
MENPTETIKENQIPLFPTGEWNFTSALVDKDEQEEIIKVLPEKYVSLIFDVWNGEHEDVGNVFNLLKLEKHPLIAEIYTHLVKRWIQFSEKPIPVSYTWDCDDLKDLFDRNDNNDVNLDYIPEYLCGDDSFWDPSEWFQYEWDDWMLDSLDETNWKTIISIFGGVSQEVAEHLINNQPQNEEEEELIEKYEEEISDIKHFIIWANNDSHENAIKNAMAEDIKDKINEHFDYKGKLMSDGSGSFSYTIEGDLRDYANNEWDKINTFEFHDSYALETLEGVVLDYADARSNLGWNLPDILFRILMEEEYNFWDYCEGKKGECLEAETKFFDGYWAPDYDVNEMLADRLYEITETPTIIDVNGNQKPLNPEVLEQFDVKRWNRLNNLDKAYILEHGPGPIRNSKNVDIPEYVRRLLTQATFESKGGWGRAPIKFILYMSPTGEILDIRGSASFTTPPNEFNIGNKVTFGDLVRFESTTNYSLTMKGNIKEKKEMNKRIIKEVVKEKIGLTAQRQFYLKQLSEEVNESYTPNDLLRLADMIDNTTSGWMSAGGRKKVMDFLFKLRDSGLVNMYQSTDFLTSGSRWFEKYVDFKHPELLEDYEEYMDEDDDDYYDNERRKLVQELIKDSDGIRDVMISNVMGRKGDNASLEELTRELRPAALDMVKLWMEFIT